jgi:hypothetical protein
MTRRTKKSAFETRICVRRGLSKGYWSAGSAEARSLVERRKITKTKAEKMRMVIACRERQIGRHGGTELTPKNEG